MWEVALQDSTTIHPIPRRLLVQYFSRRAGSRWSVTERQQPLPNSWYASWTLPAAVFGSQWTRESIILWNRDSWINFIHYWTMWEVALQDSTTIHPIPRRLLVQYFSRRAGSRWSVTERQQPLPNSWYASWTLPAAVFGSQWTRESIILWNRDSWINFIDYWTMWEVALQDSTTIHPIPRRLLVQYFSRRAGSIAREVF